MANKRAVVYTRISVSADESVSLSRQEKSCRAYAEARDWRVVSVFSDDGVSASKNKPDDRAGWSALLSSREKYDVVVVWKVDRLARRVLDFLNADSALQQRGAAVVAVEDPVDMSTSQGRAFATILAVFAEMEADAITSRVKAARVELINSGRVAAGLPPYGYMNKPLEGGKGFVLAKHPDEHPYLVEAVRRYLAGESMYQIAQDFAARRVPTKRKRGTWHNATIQKMFDNPVLAGMTPYNPGNGSKVRGEAVLRGTDGMPVIRADLAVLSPAEHRALKERMHSRSIRKVNGTNPLLSGLVECAKCDARMYRAGRKGGTDAGYIGRYKCKVCNAYASRIEELVEAQFLKTFGAGTLMTLGGVEVVDLEYNLAEIEQQIQHTAQAMTRPGADIAELADRMQALSEVRERAAEEAEELEEVQIPDDSRTVAEAWAYGGLEERRELLSMIAGRVRVKPHAKGLTLAERVSFRSTAETIIVG